MQHLEDPEEIRLTLYQMARNSVREEWDYWGPIGRGDVTVSLDDYNRGVPVLCMLILAARDEFNRRLQEQMDFELQQ